MFRYLRKPHAPLHSQILVFRLDIIAEIVSFCDQSQLAAIERQVQNKQQELLQQLQSNVQKLEELLVEVDVISAMEPLPAVFEELLAQTHAHLAEARNVSAGPTTSTSID
jgi:hypothetical protein